MTLLQTTIFILTPIPQANGAIKNRPTLILRKMPKYQDLLVCGVSTQLKQYVPNFDEIISLVDLVEIISFCFANGGTNSLILWV